MKINTPTISSSSKKLRAEKREEKQRKLRERQTGLAEQVRKMKTNKDYAGDVKKFV